MGNSQLNIKASATEFHSSIEDLGDTAISSMWALKQNLDEIFKNPNLDNECRKVI